MHVGLRMNLLSSSEANYANFHWDILNGMNVCGNPDLQAERFTSLNRTSLALIILSKIWIMQLIHIRTQLSQVIDDHINDHVIILTQHFVFILLFHQSFEIRSCSQKLPLVLFSELTWDFMLGKCVVGWITFSATLTVYFVVGVIAIAIFVRDLYMLEFVNRRFCKNWPLIWLPKEHPFESDKLLNLGLPSKLICMHTSFEWSFHIGFNVQQWFQQYVRA